MAQTQAGDARREFFATCPGGFEGLLAGELAGMGLSGVRPLRGQVAFAGALSDGYRACLWSRLASRVVLVLAHVGAASSDELYEGVSSLPWEDHLALTTTFAVDAHGTNDALRNTQFVALRAKDAICDHLQARLGGRPSVDARHPDVNLVVRVRQARATVGVDLSGTPLFRRSTARRNASDGLGSLRPDYAAALLAAGTWHRCCRRDEPALLAVFPGAGEVLAEAAGQALDRACGLTRTRWGFERWLGHDAEAWSALVAESEERAEKGAARTGALRLVAADSRPGAEFAARDALRAAGIEAGVSFASDPGSAGALLSSPADGAALAVADLSWLEEDALAQEVAALGFVAQATEGLPANTPLSAYFFGDNLPTMLGRPVKDWENVPLGREVVALGLLGNVGDTEDGAETAAAQDSPSASVTATPVPAPPAHASVTLRDGTRVPVLVAASDQFAARLAKASKLRAKWARREDVSCYRVYDADLPDYAVAIDLYQASEASRGADKGARWLVVQEYAAPKGIDPDLAHRRLLDVLAVAPRVLGIPAGNVEVRVRRRARGGSQYASEGRGGSERRGWLALGPGCHLVDEGGLTFEVNFSDYLDTGLFLDHRDVRAEVREMAKGMLGSRRFLNLFAYTGTATCYAADGGSGYTTTVDLSATYLEWARRNMARNGFTGPEHEFVQADVVQWVSEQRHTRNRWDLVFCDPPTFSNSKRMGKRAFDVQRDHAELLIGISRLLTRDGVCLFSCNLRGFVPDEETLAKAGVEIEDVTAGTIPEDFSRNAKIHHCYLVRRTPLSPEEERRIYGRSKRLVSPARPSSTRTIR